jgi:hypothetical protein
MSQKDSVNAVEDPQDTMVEKAMPNHDALHTDAGLEYYLQAQSMDPARRDEVARRVLKKIDFCLLPAVSLSYSLHKMPYFHFQFEDRARRESNE